MKRFRIGILFLLFFLLFSFFSCRNQVIERKPKTVRTARACYRKLDGEERSFPFFSLPYRQSCLSFRVGGPLQMDIQPGDAFRKGDTLASVDDRDYREEYQKAMAVYRQAEEEFGRVKALFSCGNVSKSLYEKAMAERDVALSAYRHAANCLADTRLTAPFDGYVQEVYVEAFQDVRPAQPVLSLVEMDRLIVEAYVPEAMAMELISDEAGRNPEIRSGSDFPIKICFEAVPDKVFYPEEIRLSRHVSDRNLAYRLRMTVGNPGGRLPGGLSGKVLLEGASADSVLVLPQSAVFRGEDAENYVWKVVDSCGCLSVVRCAVGLGRLLDESVEICSGIVAGESVAVSSKNLLYPNAPVRLQE